MKNLSWDDLQIFAHVARAGGLTGAAETLSLSAPTIGRRMLALEQVIGKPLFVRSRTGYALTDKGQSLLRKVKALQYWAAHPGEVCPAKWEEGADTLAPSLDLVGKI